MTATLKLKGREAAKGLRFPEGPIAMNDGSVILTEIEGGVLTRVSPDGSTTTVAECGGGPNGAAIGPDGAIWVTNNGGSFTWLKQDGLTIPGQSDTHLLTAVEGIPGALIGLGVAWLVGSRREAREAIAL